MASDGLKLGIADMLGVMITFRNVVARDYADPASKHTPVLSPPAGQGLTVMTNSWRRNIQVFHGKKDM